MATLEQAIKQGLFTVISSPSVAVVQKIVAIGKSYKGTPPLAKKWMQ